MAFELKPTFDNDLISVIPLEEDDFERLYSVASDPLIWAQHPNQNRYQKDVFRNFFKGAIESGGALIALDQATGEVVGSSRYYSLLEEKSEIAIGYTFIGRKYWGKGYNTILKKLMIEHAFKFVDRVIFHIGATNYRSQKAIEKIGATKYGEIEIAYYGEAIKWNFVYEIYKKDWPSVTNLNP